MHDCSLVEKEDNSASPLLVHSTKCLNTKVDRAKEITLMNFLKRHDLSRSSAFIEWASGGDRSREINVNLIVEVESYSLSDDW